MFSVQFFGQMFKSNFSARVFGQTDTRDPGPGPDPTQPLDDPAFGPDPRQCLTCKLTRALHCSPVPQHSTRSDNTRPQRTSARTDNSSKPLDPIGPGSSDPSKPALSVGGSDSERWRPVGTTNAQTFKIFSGFFICPFFIFLSS